MTHLRKPFIRLLTIVLLIGTLGGCNTHTPNQTETDTVPNSVTDPIVTEAETMSEREFYQRKAYRMDDQSNWLKLLDPRMQASESEITCDWSCAGFEFRANCQGDVRFNLTVTADCYFRAYVDGNPWMNGDSPYYHISPSDSKLILKGLPRGEHSIRIVKASHYLLALASFSRVDLEGQVSDLAPADNGLYIEYIGDSLSCGWGVMGSYTGNYLGTDGTLAYPYLVSQELDADYSVVALSGRGLLAGELNITMAYSYASYNRDHTVEYDFARKADIVVINIGSNDCRSDSGVSEEQFGNAYKEIIATIREKHGADCKILAVYNAYNDGYQEKIQSVMKELGGTDAGLYTLKLDRCKQVHNTHPSAEENEEYARIIGNKIDYILSK